MSSGPTVVSYISCSDQVWLGVLGEARTHKGILGSLVVATYAQYIKLQPITIDSARQDKVVIGS